MAPSNVSFLGISHLYTSKLVAFEHTPHPSSSSPQNLLIWVGGLGDGLLTVPYPAIIAKSLPEDWSLAQALLSSSYQGWATASLASDAAELALCVSYFRGLKKGKIVIMGHSTGSQDVMEYLLDRSKSLHPVDGGIIQAPVSDREGMKALMRPGLYQHSVDAALKMVESGKGEDIMPSDSTECFFGPMVSARRWLSLASPNKDGDDDYFSSDLKDEQLARTFGSLPPKSPLLILCSGSDEYMPLDVEKQALLDRWIKFIKAGTGKVDAVNSGIIANATHNLKRNPEDVVQELVTRVLQYLLSLSKTVGSI